VVRAEPTAIASTLNTGDHPARINMVGTVPATASRVLLAERLHRGYFVVLHIENGVEFCDLQKVVDLLGQVQQFEFAALFLGSGEGTDKFADTRAVDIVHVAQVQQDSRLPLGKQIVHGITHRYAAFTESDSAFKVDDRDVIRLTGAEIYAHWIGPSFYLMADYLIEKSIRKLGDTDSDVRNAELPL